MLGITGSLINWEIARAITTIIPHMNTHNRGIAQGPPQYVGHRNAADHLVGYADAVIERECSCCRPRLVDADGLADSGAWLRNYPRYLPGRDLEDKGGGGTSSNSAVRFRPLCARMI